MFAFDIETVPLPEALAAEFDRSTVSPPANYKNPEAIEGWYAKEAERWRERRVKECSTNPRLGRIVAIGFADAKEETAVLAKSPAEEFALLGEFWRRAAAAASDAGAQVGSPHLITWNGGFDLRFILLRSLALGVEIPVHPSVIRSWLRKYDSRTHFDVKAVLVNHDTALMRDAGEGLDAWCAFFGLEGKPDGASGADVYAMVLAEEWEKLAGYARHDARSNWQLYARIARAFAGGE